MDRAAALDHLPTGYAEALRLHAAGYDPERIAARLAVPVEAVGPMLRLAEAKLARLLANPPAPLD